MHDRGYGVQEINWGALGISWTLRSHSQCGGSWPTTGFAKMSRKLWYFSRTCSSIVFSLGSFSVEASTGGFSGCFALNMRALSWSFGILAVASQATRTSSIGKAVGVLSSVSSGLKAFSRRAN